MLTMVSGGKSITFLLRLLISLVLASPAYSVTRPAIAWRDEGRSAVVPTKALGRFLAATEVGCPLDFTILNTYTWINQACAEGTNTSTCCTAALSGMGLGLAMYLRDTGFFELQDAATTDACLNNFQLELQHIGVSRNVINECFLQTNSAGYTSSMFIRSPSMCQGIETVADFQKLAGVTAVSSCKSNLNAHDQCTLCVNDIYSVIDQLSTINATTSKECLDFVLLYAAGYVNTEGPWNAGTAYCILAVETGIQNSAGQRIGLYVGLGAMGAGLLSIAGGLGVWVWLRRKRAAVHREFVARNNKMLKPNSTALVWYDWVDLKSATHGFSEKCLLGQGAFGSVYKGVLKDGRTVAVKRFRNCTPEGDIDFLNEVEVISKVKHRHLVVLNGCCVSSSSSEGHQRMLVYDFMSHGSLADYLFNKSNPVLEWPERRKIALGMARGLSYLHSEVVPQIIHRDIKASNILLDEQFNARVADFGLAKLTPEDATHYTSHVAGTHGYVAPEYALYGQLTEKSDVYSFGVCLLELLSGRPALAEMPENPQLCLVTDWAWWLVKEGRIMDIVDENIRQNVPQDMMQRFVMVGILCAHILVAFRPTMNEALRMLEGDCEIPDIPDRPLPLTYMMGAEDDCCYSAQSTTPSTPGGVGSMSQRELLR